MSYVAMSHSMSQQDKKASAKKLFDQGETIAAIARQLEVSRRTIERWADEGVWREKRGVIPIGEAKSKSQPKPTTNSTPHRNPSSVRSPRRSDEIDEMQIVDTAILDISTAMSTASTEDLRSLGGLAGGLCRLIELRLKLQPRTAKELAEQVIAMEISPQEFVAELKRAWQVRA